LKVRGNIAGDYEMRLVANEILQVLKSEAPAAFFDFEVVSLEDGSPSVVHFPGGNSRSEERKAPCRAVSD
jgi:hypothetical protein